MPPPIDRDFGAIQARDTLEVLTNYNSTSYFLYRGTPMGYEYELLEKFAEEHDLYLKMRVASTKDSLYYLLNSGEGDVVADRLIITDEDSGKVAYSHFLYETNPVVVQRIAQSGMKPQAIDSVDAWEPGAGNVELRVRAIREPSDLAGRRVTLAEGSPFEETLIELDDTLTGDIVIAELDSIYAEERVIRMVSRGDIRFTVSSENIAALEEEYLVNIAAHPVIAEKHRVRWAVRNNSDSLLTALNTWIDENKGSAFFNQTYSKYFIDRQGYRERVESVYLTSETGILSDFDTIFRVAAQDIGWDWRLLAAQAYQESRFKPRARSWAGAMGLLQVMPRTGRQFGITDFYDPEDNVGGAVRFIEWLQDYWDDKILDEEERLKFILASYNTGHGHVEDARRLAEKYGNDPNVWDEVAFWLLRKSNRKYYRDPVVKYGYSRGLEPVAYVAHILERYEHYREFVTQPPPPEQVEPAPLEAVQP
ncbi:MAG: transporter substrate-binding domain-containing protein [Rhodothermales bacterium]